MRSSYCHLTDDKIVKEHEKRPFLNKANKSHCSFANIESQFRTAAITRGTRFCSLY